MSTPGGRRATGRDLAWSSLFVLLPLALFALFFHVQVLDPHNIGWLLRGEDNGEGALGLHAWLNDPAAHGLRTRLLNFPDGVSLLFTDSNPLLALVLSPFAGLLGTDVQFVGLSFLIALVLHVLFAWLLLRDHAPSRPALWFGVGLLSLLPTFFVRTVNVNLFNHWTILCALWLFASPRRAGDWRGWSALVLVTAAIHSYLLAMVVAIWVPAVFERLLSRDPGLPRRRRIVLALASVGTLGLALAILVLLGVDANVIPTMTYGRFGMPVDAPWNPALPSFSLFLPATAQASDRQLEAFQYLGAGLLILLAASPFIIRRTDGGERAATLNRRLVWLVPSLLALTAIAISHRIDFAGRTLATIPLSDGMLAGLDPLRASSRMFWPVAYVLALVAITAAYRMPSRAALLVGGALALQLLDMVGLVMWTRAQTAAATPTVWVRTRDPRWQGAIARARDITFVPGDATRQLDLFQEIAWRAASLRRPMRIVYAARLSRPTLARVRAEDRAFYAGDLAPDRLYVLLPAAAVPAGAAGRTATLDGIRVVLPLAALPHASSGTSQ